MPTKTLEEYAPRRARAPHRLFPADQGASCALLDNSGKRADADRDEARGQAPEEDGGADTSEEEVDARCAWRRPSRTHDHAHAAA